MIDYLNYKSDYRCTAIDYVHMRDFSIKLKPVYSCPADTVPSQIRLPAEIPNLSWHQVETWNALNNPDFVDEAYVSREKVPLSLGNTK